MLPFQRKSKTGKPALWWCYVRLTWHMMLISGLYKLFGDLLAFVAPWVIDRVITYVLTSDESLTDPVNYANEVSSFLIRHLCKLGSDFFRLNHYLLGRCPCLCKVNNLL